MRAALGGLGGGLAPRSLSERGACAPNGRPLTVAANGCAAVASARVSPHAGIASRRRPCPVGFSGVCPSHRGLGRQDATQRLKSAVMNQNRRWAPSMCSEVTSSAPLVPPGGRETLTSELGSLQGVERVRKHRGNQRKAK